jgi:hypothetical protein
VIDSEGGYLHPIFIEHDAFIVALMGLDPSPTSTVRCTLLPKRPEMLDLLGAEPGCGAKDIVLWKWKTLASNTRIVIILLRDGVAFPGRSSTRSQQSGDYPRFTTPEFLAPQGKTCGA